MPLTSFIYACISGMSGDLVDMYFITPVWYVLVCVCIYVLLGGVVLHYPRGLGSLAECVYDRRLVYVCIITHEYL